MHCPAFINVNKIKMGNSKTQKKYGNDCVAVICMVQMYQSEVNKAGLNWLQTNGGFDLTRPIFRAQIGLFPNVMELFHLLAHPPLNQHSTCTALHL